MHAQYCAVQYCIFVRNNATKVLENITSFIRESIASVCVLGDKQIDNLLIVVRAHLYWNLKCVDIKLLQAITLLRHVNIIAEKLSPNVNAVVLCGDFNSYPSSAAFLSWQLDDSIIIMLIAKIYLQV